jgi:hypothetical protein
LDIQYTWKPRSITIDELKRKNQHTSGAGSSMDHPERAVVEGATTVGVVKAEAEANRHARVKDRIIMVEKERK